MVRLRYLPCSFTHFHSLFLLSSTLSLLPSTFLPPVSSFLHRLLLCDVVTEREEPRNDIITAHQTRIEGSAAEMICSLCAKDVTWWKAGDLPNGRRAVSNGTFLISGHVLRLGSLHTRDSGQYCCHGNNTEGTVQQACTQLEVVRTSKLTVYTHAQGRSQLF